MMLKNLALILTYKHTAKQVENLNSMLLQEFKSEPLLVNDVLNHIILKGKRIRPILLFLVAKCYRLNESQGLLKSAFAIELIHTASLLHDDVVDQTKLRRGKKTANTIWGNKEAVLVGDHLFTQAFIQIAMLKNHEANIKIAQACQNLTNGEILQLQNEGNLKLTMHEYLNVVYCKTASLFEASAFLGALFAEGDLAKSSEFGKNIGMIFQIIDDILDYFSNETGKDLGTDLKERKVTLPIILLLQRCSSVEKKAIIDHFTEKANYKVEDVISLMKAYNIQQECLDFATIYIEKAREFVVNEVKSTEMQQTLNELLDFSTQRTF